MLSAFKMNASIYAAFSFQHHTLRPVAKLTFAFPERARGSSSLACSCCSVDPIFGCLDVPQCDLVGVAGFACGFGVPGATAPIPPCGSPIAGGICAPPPCGVIPGGIFVGGKHVTRPLLAIRKFSGAG